jgi:hypothetical protein
MARVLRIVMLVVTALILLSFVVAAFRSDVGPVEKVGLAMLAALAGWAYLTIDRRVRAATR